jgi:hypothetical protein
VIGHTLQLYALEKLKNAVDESLFFFFFFFLFFEMLRDCFFFVFLSKKDFDDLLYGILDKTDARM